MSLPRLYFVQVQFPAEDAFWHTVETAEHGHLWRGLRDSAVELVTIMRENPSQCDGVEDGCKFRVKICPSFRDGI